MGYDSLAPFIEVRDLTVRFGYVFALRDINMDFVRNVCDSTMLMRNGKLALAGQPDEVLAMVTEDDGQKMMGS